MDMSFCNRCPQIGGFRASQAVVFLTVFLPLTAWAQFFCQAHFSSLPTSLISEFENQPTLNTSNPGKKADYSIMAEGHGFSWTFLDSDVDEPQTDPLKVVTYKASQFLEASHPVLVEDQRLDIEGADVGVNLKQALKDGSIKNYEGHRATWVSLLALAWQGQVYVFEGQIHGRMTGTPAGDGPGFHNYFVPDQSNYTLGENLQEFTKGSLPQSKFDARRIALIKLLSGQISAQGAPITNWLSHFQGDDHSQLPVEDPNWMFNLGLNGGVYSLEDIGTGESTRRLHAQRAYGQVATEKVNNKSTGEQFEFEEVSPQEPVESINHKNFREKNLVMPNWIEANNILTNDYAARVVFYSPNQLKDARSILLANSKMSRSQIRKNFVELIKLFHNDRLGLQEGTEEFERANLISQILSEAWATLSNSLE